MLPMVASELLADFASEPLPYRLVRSLSTTEFTALERLAFEYGESPDSYLAVEPDRYCILTADHSAAVSVIPTGRCLHCSGGILASADNRRQMIARLSEFARRTNRVVACYSITERDRPLFEEAGWEVSKFGEDTTLKLDSLNWSGKPFEWIRRQFNYGQRSGLVCREVNRQQVGEESWKRLAEELFEIFQDDLRGRFYSREMNLLVGKLQPDNLGRRRLFVAENRGTGQIEAFVVSNPMRGGKAWALEMFRKRGNATRGAIPFLIKATVDMLRAEGTEEVSLSMLLWKDTHKFVGPTTSSLLRWGLVFGYHVGDIMYRTKGLTHFKTRFRPELSNCYVCVTPRTTIFSSLNFLYTVGAFSFTPWSAARYLYHYLTRGLIRKD